MDVSEIASDLKKRVGCGLIDRGFNTDDGLRYIRRKGHLLHYFIFSPFEASKDRHICKVEGEHLKIHFGECVDYSELQLSSEKVHKQLWSKEFNNHYAYMTQSHRKKAAAKIEESIEKICTERFSRIPDESSLIRYRYCGLTCAEKVFHLTLSARHKEANDWLELMSNEFCGLRVIAELGSEPGPSVFIDGPSSFARQFKDLSIENRVRLIYERIRENVAASAIGYLYEDV